MALESSARCPTLLALSLRRVAPEGWDRMHFVARVWPTGSVGRPEALFPSALAPRVVIPSPPSAASALSSRKKPCGSRRFFGLKESREESIFVCVSLTLH